MKHTLITVDIASTQALDPDYVDHLVHHFNRVVWASQAGYDKHGVLCLPDTEDWKFKTTTEERAI